MLKHNIAKNYLIYNQQCYLSLKDLSRTLGDLLSAPFSDTRYDPKHSKSISKRSFGNLDPVNPRMGQSLACRQPPLCIPSQQAAHKVHCIVTFVKPATALEVQPSSLDRIQDFIVIFTVEGRRTTEHDVGHHSHTPKISRSIVLSLK